MYGEQVSVTMFRIYTTTNLASTAGVAGGKHTHTHTHVCFCELWGLSIDFYYFYSIIILYWSNNKPTPYRTLKVCIVTLSDKHNLLFLIIFSLMGTAGQSLQCQTFQVLLSLWGPNVALTSTHSHKHILINIYADIYYFSTHKSHSDSNITLF